MVSFKTVEKTTFKEMLATLDKQYDTQYDTRKYFSQTAIPNLYNETRASVVTELKSASFIALTTDMWSSVNMTPYMSLTAHYISKDWQLEAKCLATSFVPENHTKDVLADAVKVGAQEWGIEEEKISCITTDNGANIIAAVRELKWPWLNCFGHNLNVAINNALDGEKDRTSRAFGVCRAINGAFSHSWQRKRELSKAQDELQLPKHALITDCATRWGSKQKMAERILEQAAAIKRVFANDRSRRPLPNLTWQDEAVLEAVNKALKPLSDFTDILSGENHVTVSSLLPTLQLLKDDVLKEDDDDVRMTSVIKSGVLLELENKYDDEASLKLMRLSALLDPRYKGDHIDAVSLDSTRV